MSFAHLHVHTQFSLLDGANKVGPLIDHAKASGMDAIAITDHGNMFGAVEFFKKAKEKGVKPIIGCEAYLAPGKRTDRTQIAVGQGVAGLQDQILHGRVRAACLAWGARAIGPVDAIEALAFGPLDPVRDGGHADAELTGNGTQGLAAPDGGDHGSTPLRLSLFLLMGFPRDGAVLGKL